MTSAPRFFHVSLSDHIFRLSANLLGAWYTMKMQKSSMQKWRKTAKLLTNGRTAQPISASFRAGVLSAKPKHGVRRRHGGHVRGRPSCCCHQSPSGLVSRLNERTLYYWQINWFFLDELANTIWPVNVGSIFPTVAVIHPWGGRQRWSRNDHETDKRESSHAAFEFPRFGINRQTVSH